jgi:F0F1-type ATP synthase membrane subunit b/b'
MLIKLCIILLLITNYSFPAWADAKDDEIVQLKKQLEDSEWDKGQAQAQAEQEAGQRIWEETHPQDRT